MRFAEIVNRDRRREPADTAGFDVHDPSAAQRDHVLRLLEAGDRFIETDRRLQPALQFRMPHDIVVRERLLDHHEPEPIERDEAVHVVERVRIVRVGHQMRAGPECVAHGADPLDVTTRLDLDLHFAVAGVERRARFFDQRRGARLDAERDSGRDFRARAADESRERLAGASSRRAPTFPSRPRPSPCCARENRGRAPHAPRRDAQTICRARAARRTA